MQRVLAFALITSVVVLQHIAPLCAAADAYAPNHFIGTCFDEAWVKKVETNLGISRYERDPNGRLAHPHLRAAIATARFTVADPRTAVAMSKLYRDDCKAPDSVFYGVDAKVDSTGKVVDPGRANGSLVVELKNWESSTLTTMLFSIITQELLGYDVSFYRVDDSDEMAQRMSSIGAGVCTPVHANVEVWIDSKLTKQYAIYSNESYCSGSIGYSSRSGLYTTIDFIKDGLDTTKHSTPFEADFWRDYQRNEDLINSLPVSALKANSKYYPPKVVTCADGTLGCVNSCSKTVACNAREAQNKECLVVAMLGSSYDSGYLQAVLENNDIPAAFCFLGYEQLEAYAVEMQASGKPVLFYHFEPDSFHIANAGKFERVLLPRSTPEQSLLTTGTFGENGAGKKTSNPVRVDFPIASLQKYSSILTQDLPLVGSLLSRMALDELQLGELMQLSLDMAKATPAVTDPTFSAACSWLRSNYEVWSLWLGRLPNCDPYYYLAHDYIGCESENSTVFPREVHSRWLYPDPTNSSMPHTCDGGLLAPPQPLVTSKSCAWLKENRVIWIFWLVFGSPACDSTFYTYDVSPCDRTNSKREVTYRWQIPDPANASLSAECSGGISLPDPVLLECGYVPRSDPRFVAVAVTAAVLASIYFIAIVFVYWNRKQPIIKRSQYQFLMVLLLGAIIVCGSAWSYAGAPTDTLCTTRASSIAYGFTLIFGSLVVKSLRVYRVFMSGAMKRVVLSSKTMFKILGVLVAIDLVIIAVWSVVDPPLAKIVDIETPEIGGDVVQGLECTSSSFIFTALLIFWKAVLLFTGLYLSFLIRKVSSDFQESVWIFASALIVLFTSVIILALAYLVELPATTFYVFSSFLQLVATAVVVALMIVPKVLRLHEHAADTQSATATGTGSDNRKSNSTSSGSAVVTAKSPAKTGEMKSIVPGFRVSNDAKTKKSKVQVTPIQQLKINDE